MRIQKRSLLCVLAALMLLTGCGAPAEGGAASPESPPAQSQAGSAAASSQAAAGSDAPAQDGEFPPEGTAEEYTVDQPVTVDGGRVLTLRSHCRRVSSGYGTWVYGIDRIDVFEGDTLLQTLSVADAAAEAEYLEWQWLARKGNADYQALIDAGERPTAEDALYDGWTSCFEDLYLPTVEDVSFDGAEDIRLMETLGTVNGRYLYWLWDGAAGQFRPGFCLVGYDLWIDHENRQLVAESRDGYDQYYEDCYQYDEAGVLQPVKQIFTGTEVQDTQGGRYEVTYEFADGQWTETARVKLPTEA